MVDVLFDKSIVGLFRPRPIGCSPQLPPIQSLLQPFLVILYHVFHFIHEVHLLIFEISKYFAQLILRIASRLIGQSHFDLSFLLLQRETTHHYLLLLFDFYTVSFQFSLFGCLSLLFLYFFWLYFCFRVLELGCCFERLLFFGHGGPA